MKHPIPEPYSTDDVLWRDVRDFLGTEWVDEVVNRETEEEWEVPSGLKENREQTLRVGAFTVAGEFQHFHTACEVMLCEESSRRYGLTIGESMSLYEQDDKKWAIVVPFAHPGDLIRVKVMKHNRLYSTGDLLEILEHSETYRGGEGDRRKYPQNGCKYFGVWYVCFSLFLLLPCPSLVFLYLRLPRTLRFLFLFFDPFPFSPLLTVHLLPYKADL